MLLLYQRVGKRAQETVNKMLHGVNKCSIMVVEKYTYQRATDMPHTVLAWKQLPRVTPAQCAKLELEVLRFSIDAVMKALAYCASTSADDLPMT
jgi:hypothetical protein